MEAVEVYQWQIYKKDTLWLFEKTFVFYIVEYRVEKESEQIGTTELSKLHKTLSAV